MLHVCMPPAAFDRMASSSSSVHPDLSEGDHHPLLLTEDCRCCARIGNNLLLCGRQRHPRGWPFHWIVGPGRIGVACSYAMILLCFAAFLLIVAPQIHPAVVVAGALNCLFLLGSFMSVSCADPGIVYKESADGDLEAASEYYNRCSQCDLERPKGARHCYVCAVCVMDLDHHCPLTGKCVGAKNADRFQVLLMTVAISLTSVSLLTMSAILKGS